MSRLSPPRRTRSLTLALTGKELPRTAHSHSVPCSSSRSAPRGACDRAGGEFEDQRQQLAKRNAPGKLGAGAHQRLEVARRSERQRLMAGAVRGACQNVVEPDGDGCARGGAGCGGARAAGAELDQQLPGKDAVPRPQRRRAAHRRSVQKGAVAAVEIAHRPPAGAALEREMVPGELPHLGKRKLVVGRPSHPAAVRRQRNRAPRAVRRPHDQLCGAAHGLLLPVRPGGRRAGPVCGRAVPVRRGRRETAPMGRMVARRERGWKEGGALRRRDAAPSASGRRSAYRPA